jgi:hypothetical protein
MTVPIASAIQSTRLKSAPPPDLSSITARPYWPSSSPAHSGRS